MGLQLDNIPPQELSSFWKKGKPLYSALYEFTAPEILQEYNDLELKLKNHSSNRDNLKNSVLPTISSSLADLSGLIFLQGEIDSVRDKLKWDLLDKILSEKLIGIGYEAPIKSSDKSIFIPLHIWPRKIKEINWDNSSILKHGINFLDIRLIKKSAFKKKPENKKKTPLSKIKIEDKKTGRPSLKNKIIEAYEYLKKEGSIDYSKTLKSHTEIIQQTVQMLNPEITGREGMQHEAIRRVISERFKTDKANL